MKLLPAAAIAATSLTIAAGAAAPVSAAPCGCPPAHRHVVHHVYRRPAAYYHRAIVAPSVEAAYVGPPPEPVYAPGPVYDAGPVWYGGPYYGASYWHGGWGYHGWGGRWGWGGHWGHRR